MLRGFYISAIVLSVVAIIISIYFIGEVSEYKSMSYSYDDSIDASNNLAFYTDLYFEYTVTAGLLTMLYFLITTTIFIVSLVRLKTTTMKVLSIIGLSLTGIIITWDVLMMISPSFISFDEVGPAWVIYALIMLAFSIVGTVHSFRKKV